MVGLVAVVGSNWFVCGSVCVALLMVWWFVFMCVALLMVCVCVCGDGFG